MLKFLVPGSLIFTFLEGLFIIFLAIGLLGREARVCGWVVVGNYWLAGAARCHVDVFVYALQNFVVRYIKSEFGQVSCVLSPSKRVLGASVSERVQ